MKRRPLTAEEEKFYAGFTRLEVTQPRPPEDKEFTVYLFRAPGCIRGWLSYVRTCDLSSDPTLTVKLKAASSAKAKNRAITLANQGFKELQIVAVNRDPASHWNITNFPDIEKLLPP